MDKQAEAKRIKGKASVIHQTFAVFCKYLLNVKCKAVSVPDHYSITSHGGLTNPLIAPAGRIHSG